MNQFCSNPGKEQWVAAKRILRYIKGFLNYGILYDGSKQKDITLIGHTYADWGSNANGRKSQSGYSLFICGGSISWASKKQSTVALSSTEAEYVAASLCVKEAIWLPALLRDLTSEQKGPTVIDEDNQGTIALSRNLKYHARKKHIDIHHHFLRDKVENYEIVLSCCSAEEMAADVVTKPLCRMHFEKLRQFMRMASDI